MSHEPAQKWRLDKGLLYASVVVALIVVVFAAWSVYAATRPSTWRLNTVSSSIVDSN